VTSSVPVYGSALSLALAATASEEAGMLDRTELIPVEDGDAAGSAPVDCQFIPVTHSSRTASQSRSSRRSARSCTQRAFSSTSTPVDGRRTDLAMLGDIASR